MAGVRVEENTLHLFHSPANSQGIFRTNLFTGTFKPCTTVYSLQQLVSPHPPSPPSSPEINTVENNTKYPSTRGNILYSEYIINTLLTKHEVKKDSLILANFYFALDRSHISTILTEEAWSI